MITDTDLEFVAGQGIGAALVWIIDGDCLYDIPLNSEYVDMFLHATSFEDVSEEYPDHDGISVRIYRDSEVIEDFCTSEYFGSILLSSPMVLNLADYPYGRYVQSPQAKFDGEKFLIFSQDVSELPAWAPGMEK